MCKLVFNDCLISVARHDHNVDESEQTSPATKTRQI